MRIAVVGAGAVGSYFGGRLAAGGHEVTFVARGANLEALRARGVRLQEPGSDTIVRSISATDDPGAVGVVDVVIVGVKAWQVAEVAPSLVPMVATGSVVLPLQNGVEAAGHLAGSLGAPHVLGGVCGIVAHLAGPGHVYHAGFPPRIQMGPLVPWSDAVARTTEELRSALLASGTYCEVSSDIRRSIWRKFVFITAYGGVGAVSGMPVGVTRSVPETRHLMEAAMAECAALAREFGVTPDGDVPALMALIDALPADSTASMQRDLASGRPSELEDQNGAVVRLAGEAGLSVPVHRTIYSALLPSELRARGRLQI